MSGAKKPDPGPALPAAPSRAARIALAVAKTELAIPAVRGAAPAPAPAAAPTPAEPPRRTTSRSGFRAPETGPTESLSHESSTKHKRPKVR